MANIITVIGIGPGTTQLMTPAAIQALQQADVIVGYKNYLPFVQSVVGDSVELQGSGMRRESDRAAEAVSLAQQGRRVAVISSGDAAVYGMASLVLETVGTRTDIDVCIIPGISAVQSASAILGAPVSHDFCCISLSDLMTPWECIERRIHAAAQADFVTAVYNPRSRSRYWQLHRLREIFLQSRSADTPVGIVRNAGRPDCSHIITTLGLLDPEQVDMFTTVIIGNSETYTLNGRIITPRGYHLKQQTVDSRPGPAIMCDSFMTIRRELGHVDMPPQQLWALLHVIHTSADFALRDALYMDDDAMTRIYNAIADGRCRTIVTDVRMAREGIRREALARLGVEAVCYLDDPRTADLALSSGITRSQAAIRLAVSDHPDALFVFGNAPTALMELCDLMASGRATPTGIVAAPVGFVHVCESKHMVRSFTHIPKIIIEGRRGGSNLAATLVNAILSFPDSQTLTPGREV